MKYELETLVMPLSILFLVIAKDAVFPQAIQGCTDVSFSHPRFSGLSQSYRFPPASVYHVAHQ